MIALFDIIPYSVDPNEMTISLFFRKCFINYDKFAPNNMLISWLINCKQTWLNRWLYCQTLVLCVSNNVTSIPMWFNARQKYTKHKCNEITCFVTGITISNNVYIAEYVLKIYIPYTYCMYNIVFLYSVEHN